MKPYKTRRNYFFDSFNGMGRRSHLIVQDLGLCITAKPAPRTTRPLAALPNPYPYGCSVLCNHPRDPELKDVVWRPRLPPTHDPTDHYDNSKIIKRTNRKNLISDVGAFVYNANWDQKISGMGALAEEACHSFASANQLAIRRCASGGPLQIERRTSKKDGTLVLDLRPWKSFDNVSSINEGQYDIVDNFERFELTSPRTRQEKPGRSMRPIRRPETFSSRSFKEGRKLVRSPPKNRGILQRNTEFSEDITNTVLSSCDGNSLSDSLHDMDLVGGFPNLKIEEDDSPIFRDPQMNGGSCVVESDIQATQEVEAATHSSYIDELEDRFRNGLYIQDQQEHQEDLPPTEEEIIQDMTWLHFPRAGDTFGARFEIPIDLRKLKTLSSLDYLSQYVVATRCRQRLNDVVFQRHSIDSKMPITTLFLGLAEILGFRLDLQSEEKLSDLIDLNVINELTREQFAGVGALAERVGRKKISRRDDLEVSDFNILLQKMSYLEMDQCLRRLFLFISQNDLDQ